MTAIKGSKSMSFAYNSDGLRISKTVNGVTTHYVYDGDLLLAEYTNTEAIVYIYDANGSPIGFKYKTSSYENDVWDVYWYAKNLQGDIVAIYSSTGTKLVSYAYNAWGVTTKSYSNSGASTTAVKNNLTYRGYYYDSDLGLYYLQSRYYDPAICRFISPDSISYLGANNDLTSYNLYSYCSNNPVCFSDSSGHAIESIWDVISLASSLIDVVCNPYDIWAWIGLGGDIIDLIPFITGVGEATDLLRLGLLGSDVIEVADDIHDTSRVLDKAGEVLELHRPYIRKSTREAVEAAAKKTPDGKFFLDANTGEVIYGKYDLGHAFDHEFWREKEIAMSKGWTQKQFNDYMNNPSFYRIELPHNNRSHKFEKPR